MVADNRVLEIQSFAAKGSGVQGSRDSEFRSEEFRSKGFWSTGLQSTESWRYRVLEYRVPEIRSSGVQGFKVMLSKYSVPENRVIGLLFSENKGFQRYRVPERRNTWFQR